MAGVPNMTISALSSGMNGINQGIANMRQDASAVAQAVNRDGDQTTSLARSLVNLKLDTLQVQASAKVVESVHDVLGHLLDVTA